MVELIKAQPVHLKDIQEMARLTWPACYKNILSSNQIDYMLQMMYSIKALENQMIEKKHQFIIAIENDEKIGFAAYELNAEKEKTKLHKLYVLPQFQGKKVGIEMMQYVEKESIRNKQNFLFLNVNKNNPAQFFYQKMKFSIVQEEIIDIGNGFVMDDFVMEKKLF